MEGSTVGLVGFGNIGKAVARKLSTWGVKLCAYDPFVPDGEFEANHAAKMTFDGLLENSDIVSLHLPLLEETTTLFCRGVFNRMKQGCILVNTARGGIISEDDLVSALEAGKIGIAALDVFENEPLPRRSLLRGNPFTVLSDHSAWYSVESRADLKRMAAETAVSLCSGRLVPAIANYDLIEQLGRSNEWQPDPTVMWRMARDKRIKQGI